jgi:hypothetical protein
VITGFIEREAVAVAEQRDGQLVPAGLVKFGLSGKDLWPRLDRLRAGPASRSGVIPVRPEPVVGVRYFGRYRSGAIRDGRADVGRLSGRVGRPYSVERRFC